MLKHQKAARKTFAAWQETTPDSFSYDIFGYQHKIFNVIVNDQSQILPFLYSFFATPEKPLSPLEFLDFWESLGDWGKWAFKYYALDHLRG